ncbi:3-dehydrosphinganine reductase [Rhizina undulata]
MFVLVVAHLLNFPSLFAVYLALSLLLLFVTTSFIMPFWRKNKMPVDGRLVVITGGSQGMGKAVAMLMASKGANVAIIARDRAKLASAIADIEANAIRPREQQFLAVSADLSDAVDARRALQEITNWGGPPDIVWTCAGAAVPGLFKDMDTAVLERQVRMNYFTVLHTAHAALNIMTSNPLPATSPKRHIIFTASVMSFHSLAGYNAYSPSKAAIRSLADGLRQECLLYNIAVHCCFPATIISPGFEEEQKVKPEITKILEGSDDGQTPDQVAKACMDRLEKGQFLVVTSALGYLMRAAAWGGSPRGNWLFDSLSSSVVGIVWFFVGGFMDGSVRKYLKQNGVSKPEAS